MFVGGGERGRDDRSPPRRLINHEYLPLDHLLPARMELSKDAAC